MSDANAAQESDRDVTGWKLWRAKILLYLVSMFRRMTLGARGMLVDGNRVLLIRHTYVPGWQFPGGGVDPGESFYSTMEREVLEETGYRVVAPYVLHGIFLNRQISRRDHVALFVARNFEKVCSVTPNREISEVRWFEVTDLPPDITRSARERIGEVFGGRAISRDW